MKFGQGCKTITVVCPTQWLLTTAIQGTKPLPVFPLSHSLLLYCLQV